MTNRLEPFAGHHVADFRFGNVELDRWLHDHAGTAKGQGTRSYVLVDEDDSVVGYFTVAPHYLRREAAPRSIGRGAPQEIPAVLLAKLAIASSPQGQALGSELLIRALTVVVDAARRVGGRVVLVDAIDDEARAFYEHHDFTPIPGHGHRLVMKLSTAAKALGLPWP